MDGQPETEAPRTLHPHHTLSLEKNLKARVSRSFASSSQVLPTSRREKLVSQSTRDDCHRLLPSSSPVKRSPTHSRSALRRVVSKAKHCAVVVLVNTCDLSNDGRLRGTTLRFRKKSKSGLRTHAEDGLGLQHPVDRSRCRGLSGYSFYRVNMLENSPEKR